MNNTISIFNKRGEKGGSLRALVGSRCAQGLMLCAVIFLAGGCATVRQDHSPKNVLAYVNGEPVTVEKVEASFTESHQGHSAFLAGQGVIRELLDKVIDKQLLLQEARRVGMDHEPQVEHSVERLRAVRAAEKFYRDKVTDQVKISQEAIEEAYKRIGDRFQVRHILVSSREAAEKALNRIKAGADFGQVAVEVSQADTAAKGGYLGVIRFGQLEPELEDKLWSLQTGDTSEPFETREGWNLLHVTDRQSVERPPLEKVQSRLRAILTKRETSRQQDLLYRELEERWKPQLNEAALQAVVKARDKRELDSATALVTIGDDKITIGQILPHIDFGKIQKLSAPIALRAFRSLLQTDILAILIRKEALAQGYGKNTKITQEVEALRDKMAVELLLDRVAFANLEASDEAAQAYWRAHAAKFTVPAAVKLSVIFTTSKDAVSKILAQLHDGADFATLARKMSEHRPSADLGGNLGWVTKGRLQPEIEKVAFSLKAGELGMAQIKAGYMIIRVEATRPQRLKPFAEVKEQAKALALKEKARAILKTWVTKLRNASVIKIDEAAIKRAAAAYEERVRQKEKAEETHS